MDAWFVSVDICPRTAKSYFVVFALNAISRDNLGEIGTGPVRLHCRSGLCALDDVGVQVGFPFGACLLLAVVL